MKKIILSVISVFTFAVANAQVHVDSLYIVSKTDTSLTFRLQYFGTSTANFISVVIDSSSSFSNPTSVFWTTYGTGTISVTKTASSLVPATVYYLKAYVNDFAASSDSVIISDTTLATPPSPMKFGSNFLKWNVTQTTFQLTLGYLTGSQGYIQYVRKSDGAIMDYHVVPLGMSVDTVQSGTITQLPGTTEKYYAIGWNDDFPAVFSRDSISITTLPISASKPYIDTLYMATITSDGGQLRLKMHVDSLIGYTVDLRRSKDNATTWSVPFTIITRPKGSPPLDTIITVSGFDPLSPSCIKATGVNSVGTSFSFVCFTTAAVTVVAPTLQMHPHSINGGYLTVDIGITSNDPSLTGTKIGIKVFKSNDTLNSISVPGATLDTLGPVINFHFKKTLGLFQNGSYYYQAFAWNSASGSFVTTSLVPFTISVSGIEEYGREVEMRVFPNPMIDRMTFQTEETGILQISDLLGKIIVMREISRGEPCVLERNNLKSGLYLYSFVSTNNTYASGKIIIQ